MKLDPCPDKPLFIIGTGRCGTKLLRDLLNQNPCINISKNESDFIPFLIRKYGRNPKFDDPTFDIFYYDLIKTKYIRRIKASGLKVIPKEILKRNIGSDAWHSILKTFFKYYAPKKKEKNYIWGNKSISLTSHIPILTDIFPNAKFIHIIRDPRDVCLSRKNIWNDNIYRTADFYRKIISVTRKERKKLGSNYFEVYYESLLNDPEHVIREICCFLECDFSMNMLSLDNPVEKRGATKTNTNIVQENQNKFLTQMSKHDIKRIEEIVYPVMKDLPYPLYIGVKYKPIKRIENLIYSIFNIYNMIKCDLNDLNDPTLPKFPKSISFIMSFIHFGIKQGS